MSFTPSYRSRPQGLLEAPASRRGLWAVRATARRDREAARDPAEADSAHDAASAGALQAAADRAAVRELIEAAGADDKAPGPDRLRIRELDIGERARLATDLSAELFGGRYVPGPARKVPVPKPNGDTRTIHIRNEVDRVAERALDAALRAAAVPGSMRGYDGPGLGRHAGLAKLGYVTRSRRTPTAVATFDVANCFPGLPHRALDRALKAAGVRGELAGQLRAAWEAGISGGVGILQGSPISPGLCDLVLTDLLDGPLREKHGVTVIRYVDDVLIAGDRDAVHAALQLADAQLQELNLKRKPGADALLDPEGNPEETDWLGFKLKTDGGPVEAVGPGAKLLDGLAGAFADCRDRLEPDDAAYEAALLCAEDAGAAGGEFDGDWAKQVAKTAKAAGFFELPSQGDLAAAWRRGARRQKATDRLWTMTETPPAGFDPAGEFPIEIAVTAVRGRHVDGETKLQTWGWRRKAIGPVPAGAGEGKTTDKNKITTRTGALVAAAIAALEDLPEFLPLGADVRIYSEPFTNKDGELRDLAEAIRSNDNAKLAARWRYLADGFAEGGHGPEVLVWEPHAPSV